MNQTISCLILGAQCATVDEKHYCKLFVAQPSSDSHKNKGFEVMSMKMGKELFDKLNLTDAPVQANVIAKMEVGSKNTMRLVAQDVHLTPNKPMPKAS